MVGGVFEDFERKDDPVARKRMFASTGASLIVYAVIGGGLVAIAGSKVVEKKEAPREVRFVKPAPKPVAPPPPPPPPPPKAAKRKAKIAGNAPSLPTELSDERLAEADESGFDSQLDTLGTGAAVQVGGTVEPPKPPPKPKKVRRAVEELPEEGTPPVPSPSNVRPAFPEDARKQGLEGVVVLRILVAASGAVEELEVLAGEEPFVSAATAAVRSWTYQPAQLGGRPIALYREIRLPFRLRARG
jgi:protein TonB